MVPILPRAGCGIRRLQLSAPDVSQLPTVDKVLPCPFMHARVHAQCACRTSLPLCRERTPSRVLWFSINRLPMMRTLPALSGIFTWAPSWPLAMPPKSMGLSLFGGAFWAAVTPLRRWRAEIVHLEHPCGTTWRRVARLPAA